MDSEILYLLSCSLRSHGCKEQIQLHLPESAYEQLYEELKFYNIEKLISNEMLYHGPHGITKIIKIGDDMKTKDQIDQEYSSLCAKLGDIEIKKGTLEFQKNEIIKKIALLAKEKTQNKEVEQ